MDKIFKALADSSRRTLLDHLRRNNAQKLSELCVDLDMTRQAVSKHLKILEDALALEPELELEDVVARIKALSPNPNSIRPATESLQALLESAPDDPEFDWAEWQAGWTAVEAEMKC